MYKCLNTSKYYGIILDDSVINNNIIKEMDEYDTLTKLYDSLNIRVKYINNNKSIKDEFQKNEDTILNLKTNIEMSRIADAIVEKNRIINDLLKIYFQELKKDRLND
jgi:hypothetical protein